MPSYIDDAVRSADDLIRRLSDKYGLAAAEPRPRDVADLGPRLRNARVQWLSGDPVQVVARQYPEELRESAIASAKGVRVAHPLSAYGRLQVPLQGVLEDGQSRPVLAAILSGRGEVRPGAAGLAIRSASPYDSGLVAIATKGMPQESAESLLLHEMRHALEGGNSLSRPSLPYAQTRLPARQYDEASDTFYRMTPAVKNYLGGANEEAVRFADARARYANLSQRLIDSEHEADAVAEMLFANKHGIGAGFQPNERVFYKIARETSPEIRARQNMLLQRLLTAAPIAAASSGGHDSDEP